MSTLSFIFSYLFLSVSLASPSSSHRSSPPTALQEVVSASRDCLVAGDSCSSDETCSPRLRTLRQCVAGNGSMKLGPGARSQCANAVSALLSSPLHGCQCKRGMKKEKNCLSIYWSLHQSVIHGQTSFGFGGAPAKSKLCCAQMNDLLNTNATIDCCFFFTSD